MKNIHVLKTDKPSRLWINNLLQGKLELSEEVLIGSNTSQHIYITSDEEIKKDEYYLGEDNNIYCLVTTVNFNGKKIILTTDADLIKDGVQAIDDEFLEWFVKNPECKEVEVNKLCYGALSGFADAGYKIIIPKEEPKQETLEEAAERTEFERYGQILTNYTKQRPAYNLGFNNGAKWQKEQDKKLYSEEDMRKMYDFGSIGHFTENESLEQSKNK